MAKDSTAGQVGDQTKAGQEPREGQQRKDYIGCLMSLISKQEIRYVGTLVMINSKEHTLVLQNVKSYGSEGRRGTLDQVPPSQRVYEHIIFKADELKDFSVIKSPFKDPAILTSETPHEVAKEDKKDVHPAASDTEPRRERESHPQPEEAERRIEQQRYTRSRGSPRGGSRGSPRRYGSPRQAEVEEYEEEYDFVKMNEKFQALFKEQAPKVNVGVKYNKSTSFYDSLSRNTTENKETPYDRQKQLQLDADTFGFDAHEYRGRGYHQSYRSRPYRRANHPRAQTAYSAAYSNSSSSLYQPHDSTAYISQGPSQSSYEPRSHTTYQPRGQASYDTHGPTSYPSRGHHALRREAVYYRRKA